MDYLARDDRDGRLGYSSHDSIGAAVDATLGRVCAGCGRPFFTTDDGAFDLSVFVHPPAVPASLSRPTTYVTVAHGSCGWDVGNRIATLLADVDAFR